MHLTIFSLKKLIFIVLFCCCDAAKKPDTSKKEPLNGSYTQDRIDQNNESMERCIGYYNEGLCTKEELRRAYILHRDTHLRIIESHNRMERVLGLNGHTLPLPPREDKNVDILNSKDPWYKKKYVLFIGFLCSLFVLRIAAEVMHEYYCWLLEEARNKRAVKGLKPLGGVLSIFFS